MPVVHKSIFAGILMLGVISSAMLYGQSACADEQETPLAESGDWAAMEHSPSETAAVDVCIAGAGDYHIGFRADSNDTEVRYSNNDWTLPSDATGTLDLKVGTNDFPLASVAYDSTTVSAVLSDDQLQSLVAAMNKASTMSVKVGNSDPVNVPLDGSNTVMAAFLTCAGKPQPGNTSTGGSNPFGSPAPGAAQ